jgi:peptide/nickel transport system substrate-binding protein
MIRAAALLALLALPALPAAALTPQESPLLAADVAAGRLPPVAERIPAEPLVVDLAAKGREPGRQGGTFRMFITRARDVRYMVVYGYARLVGYDHEYRLKPDILRAIDNEGDRVFTLHLRKGHRWSDGHPFTAEDFRYFWEDVANDPDISPGGPPELLLVDGKPPVFTIIDAVTVRYEFPAPNPRFLNALAQARDPFIYRPAHYLKQFHAKYVPAAELKPLLEKAKVRNWAALHNARDNMYNFDNPDLPTLHPWVVVSDRAAQGFDLVRNPYYHRIDINGVQLPYVDRFELTIAAGGLIPQKINLGEADLQVRSLTFQDAPVLKQGEKTGGYRTFIWVNGSGSEIALYPNQNYADPAFRTLFRDVRFRRALSLAINRKAINKALYFGLAKEANVAPLEGSPFFDPALSEAWAQHDPEMANRLLDEIGLDRRASDGVRLLPDGQRLEIIVETAGERPEEADALELVAEMWGEVGIRLIFRPLDRDILRDKVYSGESMMPVWTGWNNGLPTPEAPPVDLAPVDQTNFSWPMWGQHFQTRGQAGEAPDTPEGQRLLELFRIWNRSAGEAERAAVWREMLAIHADQIFAIGLVSGAPQPLIASTRLRNVPKTGIYAWEPGAHLGVHRIDEFWYAD